MSEDPLACLAHGFGDEIAGYRDGVMLNGALFPPARGRLMAEQPFRPAFLELEKAGYPVEPWLGDELPGKAFAIVLAGRSRDLNQRNLLRAWNALPEGAPVYVAGGKTGGINPLRKQLNELAGDVDARPKYHSLALRAFRKGGHMALPPAALQIAGYTIPAGSFSHDGPDSASVLLMQHVAGALSGRVADLGAGWGFLSAEAARNCNRITALDLFEADWHALEAARTNLSDMPESMVASVSFNWCDVTTEFPRKPYDCVLMNPPFHTSRAAVPELGRKFIAVAASTLASGGRLFMVANRNLPYEETLKAHFRKTEKLADEGGFKVLRAIK